MANKPAPGRALSPEESCSRRQKPNAASPKIFSPEQTQRTKPDAAGRYPHQTSSSASPSKAATSHSQFQPEKITVAKSISGSGENVPWLFVRRFREEPAVPPSLRPSPP